MDSSTLSDLRTLFEEVSSLPAWLTQPDAALRRHVVWCATLQGVRESDTILLLATKGLLTRPWCALEILEAKRANVPFVLVHIESKGFDAEDMRDYINNIETRLAVSDPSALELLHKHLGHDLSELQEALLDVLPRDGLDVPPVRWNPHASDNGIVAHIKDIVQAMAIVTGREQRLVWKEAATRTPSQSERSSSWPWLAELFTFTGGIERPAAIIVCHATEALAEARVLQSALSTYCQRRVLIGAYLPQDAPQSCGEAIGCSANHSATRPAAVEETDSSCGAVVLLLTKSTLLAPGCLIAVARATLANRLVIPVMLQGRGYDFAAGQQLLSNLRAGLGSRDVAVLMAFARRAPALGRVGSILTAFARHTPVGRVGSLSALRHPPIATAGLGQERLSDFDQVEAKLAATIPNLIAINWLPEGGNNLLAAAVRDIAHRMAMHSRLSGSAPRFGCSRFTQAVMHMLRWRRGAATKLRSKSSLSVAAEPSQSSLALSPEPSSSLPPSAEPMQGGGAQGCQHASVQGTAPSPISQARLPHPVQLPPPPLTLEQLATTTAAPTALSLVSASPSTSASYVRV